MLQCLNNVPRPLSHQHKKLQSSSHCFHCSTTCSPIHTHIHTRAHSFSRWLPPPLFLSIPSSSASLHSFYLCHWKDPPPLPFPLLSPPLSCFLSISIFHLSLSTPALTTRPADLWCCSQGAVCSNLCPGPMHRGQSKSIHMLSTVRPTGTHTLVHTAQLLGDSRYAPELQLHEKKSGCK